jgi:hypothetical protein
MPAAAPPFIPVHSSIRAITSRAFTGRILVTGDSTGAVLLTTRPTREGRCLRALEVRVRDLGIAHRREKWYLQIRLISSRLEVLEVSFVAFVVAYEFAFI